MVQGVNGLCLLMRMREIHQVTHNPTHEGSPSKSRSKVETYHDGELAKKPDRDFRYHDGGHVALESREGSVNAEEDGH